MPYMRKKSKATRKTTVAKKGPIGKIKISKSTTTPKIKAKATKVKATKAKGTGTRAFKNPWGSQN